MLGRIVAVTLAIGAMSASNQASAQSAGDVAAGVATALVVGAVVATTLPQEHREPLHRYIRDENRVSYRYDRYDDDVVVGRTMPPGAYQSYPVPDRYGVTEHHYTVINDHPVIYHKSTGRIVHVY